MTGVPTHIPRSTIEAVLRVPAASKTLGPATNLYLALLVISTPRGIAIRTRMRLAEMLGASESEIDQWIVRLAKLGLVIQKTPSPYLVIHLPFWSGNGEEHMQNPEEIVAASDATQRDVSVSKQAAAAAKAKSGDGVQGEGGRLLAEARETVGEGDELPGILAQYPAPIVRRALARVRATPEHSIRKSKLALFRFLLMKFSDDAYGHPMDHAQH